MTSRKKSEFKPEKIVTDRGGFYFENLPEPYKENIPDVSLTSLENEINLSRFVIRVFFEKVMASAPDLKELGEAIYRVGSTVMQISRLVTTHHKLEGEANPVQQLQKALEEILSDMETSSSKKE